MRKIISLIIVACSVSAYSQVIIGNETGTAATKTSVLLEFAAGQNKGLILPYVRTLPTGSTLAEGTMLLDTRSANTARVMVYRNGAWFDLSSGNTANLSTIMTSQPTNVTETSAAKTIIGATTSNADGVLVLESNSQAMVLPTVQNTADIPSPAPGMMVYVNRIGGKRLAVYNGSAWTYWKPQ
ncbi:hypothetical protein CO230_11645 [Chryseobacterium sp. 6424]|uniref:hypothetical protein n=1 Tax=Chryseobacterium sp. 6424 TaxID=2039166 RepID=UPI000EFD5761|nr:hypothetical protein [Chryseobacterium sp. 6424]AYO58712.1 hypothetical protein CO230_11645 [Chryseobacterium sp. 6424]